MGQRSLKVMENGTIWKLGYGLLPLRDINLKAYIANNPNTQIIQPDRLLSPGHLSYCCYVARTV